MAERQTKREKRRELDIHTVRKERVIDRRHRRKRRERETKREK